MTDDTFASDAEREQAVARPAAGARRIRVRALALFAPVVVRHEPS